MRILSVLALCLTALGADLNVMPLPASYHLNDGRLPIDGKFRIAVTGYSEPRLQSAALRTVDRLSRQTGIPMTRALAPDAASATLVIECERASKPVQSVGEDESYKLTIDSKQARLHAANPLGILRGLATFAQLVTDDKEGIAAPAITIDDQPRFPWRGLMIDASRHWMPLEVVRRTLDGMEAVKMNVLHWHLSDDQGWRVECKKYPKLHQLGSDGNFYTQDQIRQLIAYARERGIRVIPEFDMPGHTTSWLVGYPELGTEPGPYQIERRWGVFQPVLDPTKDQLYTFLDGLIGEMAALFPDAYFHVGGDEVEGKQWIASARVQAFMAAHNLKGNHELQRYFNRRLQPIVTKHGKRMLGWDEILDPDLPKDIVIQSWRGQKSLVEAAKQGYSGLLSSGYYLDLIESTERHYTVDPLDETAAGLTAEQRARILGGESCMWAEYVTTLNVDSRIWPRNAAIAERLWSPATVKDLDSMHRRMEIVSRNLEWLGLNHRSSYRPMLERLAGADPIGPLVTLADVLEPTKGYTRETAHDYTVYTPLNRLVDAIRPESKAAIDFRRAVRTEDWKLVRRMLTTWQANDERLRPTLESHGLLTEVVPVSARLTTVAAIGLDALDRIEKVNRGSTTWTVQQTAVLTEAAMPKAELVLMIVPAVRDLVDRASRIER